MNTLDSQLNKHLEQLKADGNWRSFKQAPDQLYNLSSNDYLGLANNQELQARFMDQVATHSALFSASSSRLLTGNHWAYQAAEDTLCNLFGSASALIFNSGYHMNLGILPALSHAKTLILADKLVHASLIDGMRLAKGKHLRYRHNDYEHLEALIERHQADFDTIIIVTESIFSMDGDLADLPRLVALKKRNAKVVLYVDEAHAVGVRGATGLGCAEEFNCLSDIDLLVGTFGKALASVGGYVICSPTVREYLINTMRPLIYSTALPPINLLWTQFILEQLPQLQMQRDYLHNSSAQLKSLLLEKGYNCPSDSHILPIIVGDSQTAVDKAKQLQEKGLYALPIRPPTVPQGSARIRVSLTTDLPPDCLQNIAAAL